MPVMRKACPCCHVFVGSPEFYRKLDAVQEKLGFDLAITSGYRCAAYNARISKKSTGRHVTGEAVDVSAPHADDKGAILKACFEAGIVSFALLKRAAGLHIDAGTVPWFGVEG